METFVFTLGPAAGVLVTLTALAKLEEWRRRRVGEAPPLREKLLRPPGYSSRRKAEELRDLAATRGITCLAASVALGYYLSRGPLASTAEISTAVLLAVGITVFFALTFDLLRKARAYHLGATGEEFMAEQLQGLLPLGYRVFHDFPGGPNWNIDHVVVGPSGVFAIETKTRRRHNPLPGRRASQVTFNGNDTLEYAWCNDRKAIPQARTNAKSLARFLASSTGEEVSVVPLVALPGWFVDLRAKCDVPILSGRQVVGFIQRERRSLDEAQAKRICHQLEQKCRDVEL
jgi:hypothetical protein